MSISTERKTLAGEYVVEAITQSLLNITEANGYATNVADVRRWTRSEDFSIEGPTIIVHFAGRQEMDAIGGPAVGYYDARCQVQMLYFLGVHPLSEEPLDILTSAAGEDLIAAASAIDWESFEAYPDRFELSSFYAEDPEESFDGVALTLHFRMRVDPDETWRRQPFHK